MRMDHFRERGVRDNVLFFPGLGLGGAEAGERAAVLRDCLLVTCRGTLEPGPVSIVLQGIVTTDREC